MLEKRMNDLGNWHFSQAAAWPPKQAGWFEQKMPGFTGRIERDKWIEQCAKRASRWRPACNVGERPKG